MLLVGKSVKEQSTLCTADGSATDTGRENFAHVPQPLAFYTFFDLAIPFVRIYLNAKITNKRKAMP